MVQLRKILNFKLDNGQMLPVRVDLGSGVLKWVHFWCFLGLILEFKMTQINCGIVCEMLNKAFFEFKLAGFGGVCSCSVFEAGVNSQYPILGKTSSKDKFCWIFRMILHPSASLSFVSSSKFTIFLFFIE